MEYDQRFCWPLYARAVAAFFAVPIAAIIQAFLATYSRQYDIIESDLTQVDTPTIPRTRPSRS